MSSVQRESLAIAWSILRWSLRFFAAYYVVIGGISAIAAIGRAIQVARRDALPRFGHAVLELFVEGARVLVLLAVIRLSPLNEAVLDGFLRHVSSSLFGIAYGAVMMLGVAGLANLVIAFVSKQPWVRNLARRVGTAATDEQSLELAASLFLKNLTVIPFMLVWLIGVVTVIGQWAK